MKNSGVTGSTVSFKHITLPAKGVFESFSDSGHFEYQANNGESGQDAFQFVAYNEKGESEPQTVTINVPIEYEVYSIGLIVETPVSIYHATTYAHTVLESDSPVRFEMPPTSKSVARMANGCMYRMLWIIYGTNHIEPPVMT